MYISHRASHGFKNIGYMLIDVSVGWLQIRVARWFISKPKIPILVNFGGREIGTCLYVKLMVIWLI
jgi:hypothetical protein